MNRITICTLLLCGCAGGAGDSGDSGEELRRHHPVDMATAPAHPADMAAHDMATPEHDMATPPGTPCEAPSGNKCVYVQKGATGLNTGASWQNAWTELNQINWASVNPGDIVKIGGGNYTTTLTLSKGGTVAQRVLVERSTESGHNGKVNLPSIQVTANYVTVDGIDKTQFELHQPNTNYVGIKIASPDPNDMFEIRNALFTGVPDGSCWAQDVSVTSGGLNVQSCEFNGSQCSEDIIWFDAPNASLKIEHSYFHGWVSICDPTPSAWCTGTCADPGCYSHSDMVSQSLCGNFQGCTDLDLTFRYNLVDDGLPTTATTHGGNMVFMTGYTNWRNADFEYNVFANSQAIEMKSYLSLVNHNNVFWETAGLTRGTDNIYASHSDNAQNSFGDLTDVYSIWAPFQYGFVTGGGTNIQADPQFLNSASICGADGVPFTADDGFQLKSSSPGINKGKSLGQSYDILGEPIAGAVDIGAYEYQP